MIDVFVLWASVSCPSVSWPQAMQVIAFFGMISLTVWAITRK